MPDQTKTRGLTLALSSLDNALKVLGAMYANSDRLMLAADSVREAKWRINEEIEANQQQPTVFVGEERMTK